MQGRILGVPRRGSNLKSSNRGRTVNFKSQIDRKTRKITNKTVPPPLLKQNIRIQHPQLTTPHKIQRQIDSQPQRPDQPDQKGARPGSHGAGRYNPRIETDQRGARRRRRKGEAVLRGEAGESRDAVPGAAP